MTVIICVDDNGGMLFGGRRQSRDRVLCERITALGGDAPVRVSAYSAKLFAANTVYVCEDPAVGAGADDVVFVEDGALPLEDADTLIVCRWNRRYPADRAFDLTVLDTAYSLEASEEFAGSSHEKITMDRYRKNR